MPETPLSEFGQLLQLLHGKQPDKYIEIRGFRSKQEILQRFVATIADAEIQVEKFDTTEWNVYFGVNPRSDKDGTDVSIPNVVVVVADIDYKAFSTERAAFAAINNTGLPPTMLVESGGGIHAYWVLTKPTKNTEEFKLARRNFITLCQSDWVHDAARILRVPGTLNTKYEEPRPVRLTHIEPDKVYPYTVFGKMSALAPRIRTILYSGTTEGFKSRSERDWKVLWAMRRAKFTDEEIIAVLAVSPAGDRYRERDGLLEHDLGSLQDEQEEIGPETYNIIEQDNAFWVKNTKGELRQTATFIFTPEALLQSLDIADDDIIMGQVTAQGTDHVWHGVALPKKAFIDRRSMAKHLPVAAWTWLGMDADVIRLLPYLMKDIQEKKIPILQGVKALGRVSTVWITETGVITSKDVKQFADAGYMYVDSKRERPRVTYQMLEDERYGELVRQIYEKLPLVNEPEVMWPIIGWYFAAAFKPVLGLEGREFPILMLAGTRGAGKTATIKTLMLPLVGYDAPRTYNCDTTEFVMLALLSSTTSIPIAFSEFRADIPQVEKFQRRLRLAYDTGVDIRGRADQTTTAYPLAAPISIDGEDEIEDPAFKERAIIVRLHPESITAEKRELFYDLSEMPLTKFAGRYVQFALGYDPAFERAVQLVHEVVGDDVADRILANLTKVVVGLLAYQTYGIRHKAEVPEITAAWLKEVALKGVLETIFMGDTARTRTLVDAFVEDTCNEIMRTGMGGLVGAGVVSFEPFIWKYEPKDNILSLHMATAYSWWTVHRKRRGLTPGTSATIKAQLRERLGGDRPGQYVIDHKSIAIGNGRSIMAYKIDLTGVATSGLDIPSSLKVVSFRSGTMKEEPGEQTA